MGARMGALPIHLFTQYSHLHLHLFTHYPHLHQKLKRKVPCSLLRGHLYGFGV